MKEKFTLILTIIVLVSFGYFEFRRFLFKKRNPINLDLILLKNKMHNKNPRHYINHFAFAMIFFAAALILSYIFIYN